MSAAVKIIKIPLPLIQSKAQYKYRTKSLALVSTIKATIKVKQKNDEVMLTHKERDATIQKRTSEPIIVKKGSLGIVKTL